METYRRDVLKDPDAQGTRPILGIQAAHSGDAVADAYLYSISYRQDTRVFSKLYGLSYDRVLSLSV